MPKAPWPACPRRPARVDDLSGVEGEWGHGRPLIDEILKLGGEVYLPFLAANEAALKAGATEVRFDAMDHSFVQPPFRYLAKCLAALRAAFAALEPDCAADILGRLSDADCLSYLEGRG
jgi:hypothetical protein